MSASPALTTQLPRRPVPVSRALGSPTRAEIYDRLRRGGDPQTVRDVAAAFDLHPNVARTHLETLADAGLVSVGLRKHPGGGRPAKLYVARDDSSHAQAQADAASLHGAGAALLVRLLGGLVVGSVEAGGAAGEGDASRPRLQRRAHEAAAAEGRRLAGQPPAENGPHTSFESAAHWAVRSLRAYAPEARVTKAGADWVDVAGVAGMFRGVGNLPNDLSAALERGLLAGALAGAGRSVTLADERAGEGGPVVLRARTCPPPGRERATPADTVDTRGRHRQAGVVQAMRAVTGLRAGEVLEVLAEGPGSPAAFARWADRAGHELLGVERATDATGRPAIRLLIRKGA